MINIKYKIFYNLMIGFYFNNIFIKIFFYESVINKNFLGFFLYYIPIYYENKNFFILNKPFNLIIHNLKNCLNNYLINNLLYYCGKKIFYIFRMGLVNRLDRNTSGIIVIYKNFSFYMNYIIQNFYNLVFKNYVIFLFGKLKNFNIFTYFFFKFYKLKIFNNNQFSITSFFNFKTFNIFNYYLTVLKCRIFSG
ncbi:pseudouridine synthase, partial [Candidatus Nasuia deltocephalinicola]|uniref:pseudouridine synthase n=1 Tax=Candidatus Nasuia deltocephalincola TaxID=1160784 RepID=UPI0039C8609E